MEIPQIKIKRQNEAIRQSWGMDTFAPIEEFACQVARAVDAAIIDFLDKKVGKSWRLEDVSMSYLPNSDPTKQGSRYLIAYKGEPVGIVRQTIVCQGNKAIGNLYIEMEEVKAG